MKQRRKFELALADLIRLASDPSFPDRYLGFFNGTWNFSRFIGEVAVDCDKARELVRGMRLLRQAEGTGVQKAEETMMGWLDRIASKCVEHLEAGGFARRPDPSTLEVVPAKLLGPWGALLTLCEYAMDCLKFKRDRDSFGGRRRSLAFGILRHGCGFLDLSEAAALAEKAVEDGGKHTQGAEWFLESREFVLSGESGD